MRKSIVLIVSLLFNAIFIYGISYANRIMFNNNFMIYLNKQEVVEENNLDNQENVQEEVNTTYNGESIEDIGKKMDILLAKTALEGLGEHISRSAITKSVNPYLVGGIILESTNCKIDCSIILKQCNNVSGLKGEPGCFGGSYKRYNSKEESITDLANFISKNYPNLDMQQPYKMYNSYGRNETWAFKVNKYMEELKRGR